MKSYLVILIVMVLYTVQTTDAQIVRISTFGQEGIVLGDFAKKDISNLSAGYVDYSSGAGLELNYLFKNQLGVGLRWSGTYYTRDYETYESDLTKLLAITGEGYDLTQTYSFWSMGSDLGIAYLLDLSDKLQLEPYVYLGFRGLVSPMSTLIYFQENSTHTYKSKPQLFVGFSFSPGLKLQWNIFKHAGLFCSFEFCRKAFLEDEERTLNYSYNSLEITDTEKSYTINSLNLGLGLSFRFGKGLKESIQ